MKYLLSIVLLALIGVTTPKKTTPAYDWGSVSAKPDLSWADQVGAQRTPKNTEWDAGKFGLRNDTSVFSTPAIQAAIDACHQQGGGTVVVAPGYYKIGALFIKSGVNLHLSKGTTLLASDNIQDYPEFPSRIAGIEMTWPSSSNSLVIDCWRLLLYITVSSCNNSLALSVAICMAMVRAEIGRASCRERV